MLLIMAISLYTSRVILAELGVTDFGIYNLVGGIILLFVFLNNTLTSATQRFLNVAIGKKDTDHAQRVFTACFKLNIYVSVVTIILANTIGLYFLQKVLSIPTNRESAAFWTYQLAILTTVVSIIRIPYNGLIIAQERMSFYAYTSIIETVLKLIIVLALSLIRYDKLIVYSVLSLCVITLITLWYIVYCKKHFIECKTNKTIDKNLIKEIGSFSGWGLLGSIGDIAYKQGTSFLVNIFYGVGLNATIGITNQVRTALYSFVSNVQVAANPQIVKSYTCKEIDHYQSLVFNISKYSYFLILLISMPVMINVDLILNIWLKNIPDYTNIFIILTLIFSLIDSLSSPLWTTMQATGNIKWYQIITSICLLLNIPITYICFKIGYAPYFVMIVQIIITIITLIIRVIFSHMMASLNWKLYIEYTIKPIIAVTIATTPIIVLIVLSTASWIRLAASITIGTVAILTAVWLTGLNVKERIYIKNYLKNLFYKIKHKRNITC